MMKNDKYIKEVIKINLLLILPFIIVLFFRYKLALGFILGSIASIINFLIMTYNTYIALNYEVKIKSKILKAYVIRYLFLILYSIIVIKYLKVNIIFYGFGLLSSIISLVIFEINDKLINKE